VRDLERITNLLEIAKTMPFEYDPHAKIFVIGRDSIALENFGVDSALSANQQAICNPKENSPLLISGVMGAVLQTPKLYNWLKGQSKTEFATTEQRVTDAIVNAYVELSGNTDVPIFRGVTHWDFGMSLYRPGHPVFRTLGDCACYGVSPHGSLLRENAWEHGFAQYDGHNIDDAVKRTSLYAGAGALARLCRIDDEPKIF